MTNDEISLNDRMTQESWQLAFRVSSFLRHSSFELRHYLAVQACCSSPRHHFKQETFEIFRFRYCRKHGMIRRLLEPANFSCRSARIHQRGGNCFGEER